MKSRKIWIVILILALVVFIGHRHFASKSNVKQTAQKQKTEKTSGLKQEVTSFTIDGRSPKGVKQWHLEGNSAEIVGEDIYLKDLKAVAYSDAATVNLSSDEGIYNKSKGAVELMGNVNIVSTDGLVLTTEKCKWSQITKEISTDSLVRIKSEGMDAVGTGGIANADEKTAMLKADVKVFIDPDTKVNCDKALEVDYDKNIAIFHENVKVEDKDGKMFADKLTVDFDPKTQKIAQVVAEGNVKVKKGKSYTLSEKAIYTDSTKSAKLLGKPRVIIAPEELSDFDGFMPKVKEE